MSFSYNLSSRNTGALFVACFGALFAALCSWLAISTGIGIFGVFMALFGMGASVYSTYFYLHPVCWRLQVSSQSIRWQSPHCPRQNREIPLSEINAVRACQGDPVALELHLLTGEIISLPSPCIGRDPQRIVDAMIEGNPQIKGLC